MHALDMSSAFFSFGCLCDPLDSTVLIGLQMKEFYYALYDFTRDFLLTAVRER